MAIVKSYYQVHVKLNRVGPPEVFGNNDPELQMTYQIAESGVLYVKQGGRTVKAFGRNAWESACLVHINEVDTAGELS